MGLRYWMEQRGGSDAMTLSYGLAVDGSSYFFCGFCDLKMLAACQNRMQLALSTG
jgi:hypothetical protein